MTVRPTRRLAVLGALCAFAMATMAAAPTAGPMPEVRPAVPATGSAKPQKPPHGRDLARKIGLSGNQGWTVVDLDSGDVLERHQAGRAFAPASVAKLPTAFYAIDTLGPDFRYQTSVVAAGTLANGRLDGDLALVGTGDPELDTDALGALAQQAAQTVRSVSGRFLADGSGGPRIVELDPGQPQDVTYNPSVTGLNLNYNRVRMSWDARKGDKGFKVTALGEKLNPPVKGFRIGVNGKPNAPVFEHSFAPGTEVWQMARRAFRGTGSRWLPVRRPELYAGQVFRDLAAERGLELPPAEASVAGGDVSVVAIHEGRRLTQVAKDMLKWSTNLTAEALGMRASAELMGRTPDTLFESARRMNDWAAALANFPPNSPDFRFANHSGLSTISRVSPEKLMELMKVIAGRPPAARNPDSRVPGALSGLLKAHNIRDRGVNFPYDRTVVAAKTGTMNYVRGLAGFVRTPKGKNLAFVYFANDIPRRDASGGTTNKGWIGRARRLERALIRHWVKLADGAA